MPGNVYNIINKPITQVIDIIIMEIRASYLYIYKSKLENIFLNNCRLKFTKISYGAMNYRVGLYWVINNLVKSN